MTNARIDVLSEGAADLRHIAVSAQVGLDFIELEVSHRFANAGSKDSIEIQYCFPVPAAAVLLELKARIGDRELVGATKPRLDAQDEYDEAVSQGTSAILLDRTAQGMYSLNLGHLGASEEAQVSYRYVLPAPWQSGMLRLALPTCIAPRYGQPRTMESWQAPISHSLAEHQVSFRVELAHELHEAMVSSPTHAIRRNGNTILLADESTFADRDFVALIDGSATPQQATCTWSAEPNIENARGIACLRFTAPDTDVQQQPRRVHFLLDSSGSMQGDSIRLAKEALLASLDRLTEFDHFTISAFGTTVEHGGFGFTPATDANKHLAIAWIRSRQANLGGTEIRGAVSSCLGQYVSGKAPDMLILTDGEFWEASDVVSDAARYGARLFVVGIGAASAADQIYKMADGSGGSAEFLTPNEEFAGALERMVARMRYTERLEVTVDWGVDPDWQEPERCLAWPGERVTLFARTPQPESATVVPGRKNRLPVSVLEGTLDSVRVGWATRIDRLVASKQTNDALATRSAELGLVNDLTSMVMLDPQQIVVGGDSPDLHKVPQMLAAGWGGSGTVATQDFLTAPSFMRRVSALSETDDDEPQAMFSRRDSSKEVRFFETRVTEYQTGGSLIWDDGPYSNLMPLLEEAARLLAQQEPATVLHQLASRLKELLGEEFETAAASLEAQGIRRVDLVAALLEKSMADRAVRQMFGFLARRKLRRFFKANPSQSGVEKACDELLQVAAA